VSATWRGRAGSYKREGCTVYRCDACAKSLASSSTDKAPAKSSESLLNHGATSCASSNEEATSLISVCTQLEAVRSNKQCTIDLL
jgi:hypothetical protein